MFFKVKIIFYLIRLRSAKKKTQSDLMRLQNKRWKSLQKTLKKSPFYAGMVSDKFPLENYPIINKSIFMDCFDEINTKGIQKKRAFEIAIKAEETRDFEPMIKDVTIGLSSGTSGNRGVFLATEKERAQWVSCVLDRVIGFSLKKRKVAFFLRANSNLYTSVKSKVLQFEFFDLLQPVEKQLSRLNQLSPTILVAQPSLLIELAKKQDVGELNIKPKKIISVAEVLYPEDKKELERVFKQTIHQVYQCTEGLLATSCEFGTLHFNEDFLIIEKKFLDDEKKRFHPVITDLFRTTQPVIRYELNDIIHEKKNCPCGKSEIGIEQIEGRSDDVLVFESSSKEQVKIFPDFFRRSIVLSDEQITDYTLIQSDRKKVELFIDGNDALYEKAKQSVLQLLEKNNILDVQFERVVQKHHEKGHKLRRIRNDYWKAN